MPRQLAVADRSLEITYPGFRVNTRASDPSRFSDLHTSQRKLPPGYAGGNGNRFSNPEFDVRIDRFYSAIDQRERAVITGELVQLTTDQLPVMPLFFRVLPIAIPNRLGTNVSATQTAWNAHEWATRG